MKICLWHFWESKWAEVPASSYYLAPVKHDDVIIVPEFFCREDDWATYYTLIKARGTSYVSSLYYLKHEGIMLFVLLIGFLKLNRHGPHPEIRFLSALAGDAGESSERGPGGRMGLLARGCTFAEPESKCFWYLQRGAFGAQKCNKIKFLVLWSFYWRFLQQPYFWSHTDQTYTMYIEFGRSGLC